jgi:hypothetical protein
MTRRMSSDARRCLTGDWEGSQELLGAATGPIEHPSPFPCRLVEFATHLVPLTTSLAAAV